MKDVKDICKEDNTLIKQYKAGDISKAKYLIEKAKCHKEYIALTNDNKEIELILKKHGGC